MVIDMKNPYKSETGCCPKFNPKKWQNKTVKWKNKLFVKARVKSFFHIPLNFGRVIGKLYEKIDKADAYSKEILMLSDENSLWGSNLYIEVKKRVKDTKIKKISGTFITKVFEGPYKDIKKWIKIMDVFVESKGKKIKKLYFFYTTCPKCAKHYGKNYVVLIAKI
mgnify:CR=1 FL=1